MKLSKGTKREKETKMFRKESGEERRREEGLGKRIVEGREKLRIKSWKSCKLQC